MKRDLWLWGVGALLVGTSFVAAGQGDSKKRAHLSGPIAQDRGVHLTLLEETRTRRGYAVPEAMKGASLKLHLDVDVYTKPRAPSDCSVWL